VIATGKSVAAQVREITWRPQINCCLRYLKIVCDRKLIAASGTANVLGRKSVVASGNCKLFRRPQRAVIFGCLRCQQLIRRPQRAIICGCLRYTELRLRSSLARQILTRLPSYNHTSSQPNIPTQHPSPLETIMDEKRCSC
jgi:hypothetical protein